MKKILTATITITACVALCAAVWPQNSNDGKVPDAANPLSVSAESETQPEAPMSENIVQELQPLPEPVIETPEVTTESSEKETEAEAVPLETPPPEETIPPQTKPEPQETAAPTSKTVSAPQSIPSAADPYHTDVYPNNVYSVEYRHDENGNLTGKITTIPTAFGPETIWIDGRAYTDVPGFGLVEWGGPNQVTEAYDMCENGNKVGIMD